MSQSRFLAGVAAATSIVTNGPVAYAQVERWHVYGYDRREVFGDRLAWLDDLDDDGIPELAVSATAGMLVVDVGNPNDDDRVRILRGADLSQLLELHGGWATSFGAAIHRCGDFDRDGVDDVLVAQLTDGSGRGVANVHSTSTGALLRVYDTPDTSDWWGVELGAVGDVDGDGIGEVVIGLPMSDYGAGAVGSIRVVGSADGATLAEWHGASRSNFGSI